MASRENNWLAAMHRRAYVGGQENAMDHERYPYYFDDDAPPPDIGRAIRGFFAMLAGAFRLSPA
jgi:hypothetical protein